MSCFLQPEGGGGGRPPHGNAAVPLAEVRAEPAEHPGAGGRVAEVPDLVRNIVRRLGRRAVGSMLLAFRPWYWVIKAEPNVVGMELVHYRQALREAALHRRQAHNLLQDAKGKIRLMLRVKPMDEAAKAEGLQGTVRVHGTHSCHINDPLIRRPEEEHPRYTFHAIFDDAATQADVYNRSALPGLVQSALDGFNVCVLCYGPTGSGKTHTMVGSEGHQESWGVMPRAIAQLLETGGWTRVSVRVGMVAMHQQDMWDLLGRHDEPMLEIGVDQQRNTVVNCRRTPIQNPEEFLEAYNRGMARLTALGAVHWQQRPCFRRRSHIVCTLYLDVSQTRAGERTFSKLSFVELAASERDGNVELISPRETDAAVDGDPVALGFRVRYERNAARTALTALHELIYRLTHGGMRARYRLHKLTELLMDSIGGNAKTLMMMHVSPLPADAAETTRTCNYARALDVGIGPYNDVEYEVAGLQAVIQGLGLA